MQKLYLCLACLALLLAGCTGAPAAPVATSAPTEAVAPTEAPPATEEMAHTEEMTSTDGMTSTEEMTSTAMSAEEKIANALSAGPSSIAANAAVMDWPAEAGGELVELRPGTNGWTCLPDDPTTPTNDPVCADAEWLEWFQTYLAGGEPEVSTIGFAYMLQGGSVADNNDPTVMEPAAGQEWQVDPPHVMLISPETWDPAIYSNDHHSGGPWVMFGGTPYEHMMWPVEMVPLQDEAGDDKIANALSAGPSSIAADAAVMDWPAEAGGELVELRPGTNGWTCFPDDPTTPTNDPVCADGEWLEWFQTYLAGGEPEVSTIGFAYMLQGGSVADNNDPTVMEPAAGQEWQVDPPHVMVISPETWDPALYSNDHHSGGPWVMFGGTPYEHMMWPVTGLVDGH